MVKKALLCIGLFLAFGYANGQDIITRTDGVEIRATALDIKSNLIYFRLFGQPDTLTYQINPRDVKAIKMADGSVRNFSPATPSVAEDKALNYETDLGRNILRLHPLDLIFSNFTFSYEHILPSGKVGFRVPIYIGLAGKPEEDIYFDTYNFRKNSQFGAGLEINFYTHGQGRFRYYLGPAFNFRTNQGYFFQGYSDPQRPEPLPLVKEKVRVYSMAVKNGVFYQISKAIILSAEAGLGMHSFQMPEIADYMYSPNNTRIYVPANLLIGFRF
jgi:hypothetical protein